MSGSSPRVWGQGIDHTLIGGAGRIIPTRMGTSLTCNYMMFRNTDHPHAYGDKRVQARSQTQAQGSSPRVWGQDNGDRLLSSVDRIIPTRMGTRNKKAPNVSGLWDHPHAYGDKVICMIPFTADRGSSPRVWGQVYKSTLTSPVKRIIPTRMGTRFVKTTMWAMGWDHPHAYGDKKGQPLRTLNRKGSSPRVWGQAKTAMLSQLSQRIIPTRMGTSD